MFKGLLPTQLPVRQDYRFIVLENLTSEPHHKTTRFFTLAPISRESSIAPKYRRLEDLLNLTYVGRALRNSGAYACAVMVKGRRWETECYEYRCNVGRQYITKGKMLSLVTVHTKTAALLLALCVCCRTSTSSLIAPVRKAPPCADGSWTALMRSYHCAYGAYLYTCTTKLKDSQCRAATQRHMQARALLHLTKTAGVEL